MKLRYNTAAFLLAMAISDKALVNIHSLEDLWDREILPGQDVKILKIEKNALSQPIFEEMHYKQW
jgi:hypothetical protein